MRTCDIEMSQDNWTYEPHQHKTRHRGHDRIIYIGPRAQRILKPLLRPNVQEFIFSPADAERERHEAMHQARKTPLSCGNVPGSNRQRRPARRPRDQYTVASYRRAIARACETTFQLPSALKEPRT